ncbi:MAG: hypothetical protein HC853_12685, partial [Anaerolineae bacterium]|nr:hypothetical protein [Anaerolineae bacterium]
PFKRRPEPNEPITVNVVWYYALELKEVDSVTLRGTYQPSIVALEK